ncbi:MAG: hypothetical protein Kow0037_30170 [Calditrichia bacterium]
MSHIKNQSAFAGLLIGSALLTLIFWTNVSLADMRFGGQYRIMFNSSNFGWHQPVISASESENRYINQRFRLNLDSRFDSGVAAHVQLEFGHNTWGENYYYTKTLSRTDSDQIGIELRHAYLNFPALGFDTKVGIQDWSDGFGGVLASGDWDFNVGGVGIQRQVGKASVRGGFFQLWEGDTRSDDDSQLWTFDLDYRQIGLAFYHARYQTTPESPDQTGNASWLGMKARIKSSPVQLNGFLLLNRGSWKNSALGKSFNTKALALKVEAIFELPRAELGLQGLYSTGNNGMNNSAEDNATFYTLEQDGQGYWSYLALFTPRGSSDTNNLRASLRNRDQDGISRGLSTIQGKLRIPLNKQLDFYTAAGWFYASQPDNYGHQSMGTEFLLELKVQLSEELAFEVGGAYALTGDFYQQANSEANPDNLYEIFSRLQLEF